MKRPPIGARVRVTGPTGLVDVDGKLARVVGHHQDGVAVAVILDSSQRFVVLDGKQVEAVNAGGAPPYASSGDAQPARVGFRP